ncbi:hypothetical protein C8F04DRAFT_1005370 [Mycena alexandri]|uniref:BTB domain-containing protein n=1 Tax=Mycena alexandri TaxID=1745969 RepID=A0AAD6SK22_9AGAR|nr:hypothetical protein C8F04DRAFT_1123853 [Mycena alexandri]KAJ7030988.1 hypothetical protein C8F04DRAFT_1005370 [Mycena alexandri]
MTHHTILTPKAEHDEEASLDLPAYSGAENLKRVDDLWFEDDTLILRAEDSIFRVSKGVLMARSHVLKTLICGLAQGNPATLDDCPVVQLDHSSEDVTSFLKAIFDSDFFLPPPAKAPFTVVIGVLRLAHAYDVKYLFRRALLHLEGFFPSTLDGEHVYAEVTESNEFLSCTLLALRAALDVGALWNIPSIMYECCAFTLAEILDDARRRDLPGVNERALILSHSKQAALGTSFVTNFLYAEPSGRCRSAAKCNVGKLVWLEKVDGWRKEGRDSVPLEFWDESDWEDMKPDFCQGCLASFQESYARGRKMFWEELPTTFGLPAWEELNKAKVEMFTGSG